LRGADSYYDVLGVEIEASPERLKSAYYDLARRYHPDRFRKMEPTLLAHMESAFARITQAYDTLRDETLRANYNAKLQARKKAPQAVDSTLQPATPTSEPTSTADAAPVETQLSAAERAANDFKEGYAALEQGQRKIAAGLFASAARLMPNEPRYRAYYGHMLAGQENTRRAAEAELQAAIKLDPKNAEYRVMLAQLFRDLGFIVRARGETERAVAADPDNRKARDLLRELKGV
jgi:curved DNA-binding protein CbpA